MLAAVQRNTTGTGRRAGYAWQSLRAKTTLARTPPTLRTGPGACQRLPPIARQHERRPPRLRTSFSLHLPPCLRPAAAPLLPDSAQQVFRDPAFRASPEAPPPASVRAGGLRSTTSCACRNASDATLLSCPRDERRTPPSAPRRRIGHAPQARHQRARSRRVERTLQASTP